ncbi:VOC family protein [Neobacillus drentensis]|uniref:VOC family protein n=1 Tax=Neobacillus drentensis TaxID=220684 RepID=UPI002FFDC14B
MVEITCLGYSVFGVSDLNAWEEFAVDILGLQVGRREENLLTLRMDQYEQRIILEESNDDDLLVAGWEFENEQELEQFVQKVDAAGVEINYGGKELEKRRRVEKVYVCDDPSGNFKHEFYCGPAFARASKPFHSKVLVGSGFVTGPLGIGHLVPIAKDYQESVKFYRDILGMRISDIVRIEVKPGVFVDGAFFHTVTGRHHTIATMEAPHPKRIRHTMLQVEDMMDVGLAYDRCLKAGYVAKGLGQHPNDKALSFYIKSPSGFEIEYGWGGIVIDDKEEWKVKVHYESSAWGHKPIAQKTLAKVSE